MMTIAPRFQKFTCLPIFLHQYRGFGLSLNCLASFTIEFQSRISSFAFSSLWSGGWIWTAPLQDVLFFLSFFCHWVYFTLIIHNCRLNLCQFWTLILCSWCEILKSHLLPWTTSHRSWTFYAFSLFLNWLHFSFLSWFYIFLTFVWTQVVLFICFCNK